MIKIELCNNILQCENIAITQAIKSNKKLMGILVMYEVGIITVVIPCYNQSKFLSEAIESVQKQSYNRHEIIVVNDGSTDNTTEVAKQFYNIRLIEQTNMGLAKARNVGLLESKGEFLVFLDADDRLLPNAFEISVKSLQNHPESAFVSGFCVYLSPNGKYRTFLAQPSFSVNSDHYMALLKKNYIWSPANVMYRRKLFDQIAGFDATVNPTADYELYLRIARQFPIHQHGEIVAEYRQHDTSMSSNPELMLKNVLNVLEKQREYIEMNATYKKAFKQGIAFYFYFYGKGIIYYFFYSLINLDLKKTICGISMLLSYIKLLIKYLLFKSPK